ncbi:hypothetical protein TNCT_628681 [Trichonephila clavata]|uniref:Secreted protein n=1 Tax=Trichonephila clavata TaxID=2740835 RepID=A0A8X6L899_TRICU|nr:hypothetical protein TNCT_628681 [Trichonephila clavata]
MSGAQIAGVLLLWIAFHSARDKSLTLVRFCTKSYLLTNKGILKIILQELKKHQFRNGTVDNFKSHGTRSESSADTRFF